MRLQPNVPSVRLLSQPKIAQTISFSTSDAVSSSFSDQDGVMWIIPYAIPCWDVVTNILCTNFVARERLFTCI
jgi:hypothetical protein